MITAFRAKRFGTAKRGRQASPYFIGISGVLFKKINSFDSYYEQSF